MNAVSGKTSMRMRYSELYSNVKRLAEKISPLTFLRKSLSNRYLTTTTHACSGTQQVAPSIKVNASLTISGCKTSDLVVFKEV